MQAEWMVGNARVGRSVEQRGCEGRVGTGRV